MNNQRVKILIIKLSSLGDVIQTLPALARLRKKFPEAHITWVVEEETAELIADHPWLDEVIIFRKNAWLRGLHKVRQWGQITGEGYAFFKTIRAHSYDFIIDFQGLLKSGMLAGD